MTLSQVIETLSLVAPLGLCFHDAATGERISDGLNVSVYPETKSVRKNRTSAFPNRAGVYVLHRAYGLENFPNGTGDAEFWQDNPPQKSYIVEVSDTENRFQSFQFTVELPVRGIYQWENLPVASPTKKLSSIPLYSAPTRKVFGGISVIRAELRESPANASPNLPAQTDAQLKPVSFAVLEARFDGDLIARGIAGKDGKIALLFPALSPQSNPLVSPPATATRVSLAEQQWLLDLTIKYEPNIFQTSPPNLSESDEEVFPDLRLVLAQGTGTIWADAGKTEEYTTATLYLGRELILRSRAEILSPMPDEATADSSFLFVSPAI
jgi:hypothetical protein